MIRTGRGRLNFANSIPVCLIAFAVFTTISTHGQSTQVESPSPITTNEVEGRIPALDIGDPRLTHHFYVFTGTKGDLILTVTSSNLNGDIDVFAQKTLRPLVKIGLYATESGSVTSKTVFLHEREPLILRVEARSPNDDPGEYKISFSGGFEAMSAAPGSEANEASTSQSRTPGTHRVTSVGATIEEPKPEPPKPAESEANAQPVATPTPTPSPEATPETAKSTEPEATPTPSPVKKAPVHRKPTTRHPPSSTKSTRTKPATEAATKPTTEPPANAAEQPSAAEVAPAPKQEIPAPPTAKIIVELKDGTHIEHSMTTVRRVLIDNGQIVIINKDGKIERLPMANVLRMAIEP